MMRTPWMIGLCVSTCVQIPLLILSTSAVRRSRWSLRRAHYGWPRYVPALLFKSSHKPEHGKEDLMEALEFYKKHDLFSDPGEYARRYQELPTEMNELHTAINELLIHNWKVERDRPGWIKAHPREVDVFTRPIRR